MDTNNLYSSLSDYRAAACTLNNSLRKVQAKIVELEHQNQLLRDRLAQKDQELLLVRQGHAFAESCNQTLRSYLGDMSKQLVQTPSALDVSTVLPTKQSTTKEETPLPATDDNTTDEGISLPTTDIMDNDHTVYLIMSTISLIIGSILNYIVRLVILSIQLGARLIHQRLMHLILDSLLKLRRKIQAFILTPEPEEPQVIEQARRYPERQRRQPDRLMYY